MTTTGRVLVLTVSSLLAFLLLQRLVLAAVNVQVNSESSGKSEANIHIESISQSNTTTISKTTGKTDIVLECDGAKKEYHSDKPGNVNISCDEHASGTARSKVNIANQTSQTSVSQISLEPKKAEIKNKKEETKKEIESVEEKIKQQRQDLFKKIRSVFDTGIGTCQMQS